MTAMRKNKKSGSEDVIKIPLGLVWFYLQLLHLMKALRFLHVIYNSKANKCQIKNYTAYLYASDIRWLLRLL